MDGIAKLGMKDNCALVVKGDTKDLLENLFIWLIPGQVSVMR